MEVAANYMVHWCSCSLGGQAVGTIELVSLVSMLLFLIVLYRTLKVIVHCALIRMLFIAIATTSKTFELLLCDLVGFHMS